MPIPNLLSEDGKIDRRRVFALAHEQARSTTAYEKQAPRRETHGYRYWFRDSLKLFAFAAGMQRDRWRIDRGDLSGTETLSERDLAGLVTDGLPEHLR